MLIHILHRDAEQLHVPILHVLEGYLRVFFHRRDSPTQTFALSPVNIGAPNSTEISHFLF